MNIVYFHAGKRYLTDSKVTALFEFHYFILAQNIIKRATKVWRLTGISFTKHSPTGVILAGIVVLFLPTALYAGAKSLPNKDLNAVLLPQAVPLSPFQLSDHNENSFNLEDLQGHWSWISFGYASCPDVCPVILMHLAKSRHQLSELLSADQLPDVFFISVDPNRDSLTTLKHYTTNFDKSFMGITGTNKQISIVEDQLGAFHRADTHQPNPHSAHDKHLSYKVSHSTDIFVVDPSARLIARLPQPLTADKASLLYQAILTHTKHYASNDAGLVQ